MGPETMTQRTQEARHHKSHWLAVSCHVTHSFHLYNICGRRCENLTLQKGKAGQGQKAESCCTLPLLCRLPGALTATGLPTTLQVLSFLPSSCCHDSSSPRPWFCLSCATAIIPSDICGKKKKKKMCTVSEYQQRPRLRAGHCNRTRRVS